MTRILVIDDEPLICRLLTYQLSGAGYEVVALQSGSEALSRFLSEQPDLVLLDVMMPDLSGWEVCRQIRTCSMVPIIMLTAKSGDEAVVAGLTSGADDYVAKPFSEPQLIARVEAALRRSRLARENSAGKARRASVIHEPPQPTAAAQLAEPLIVAEADSARPPAPDDELRPRLGTQLSAARQCRGLSLHEAERACGVRWEFLQALELEHFSFMPRAELRNALRSYSTMLGVDLQPFIQARPAPNRRWPERNLRNLSFVISALLVLVLAVALSLVVL